MRKFYITGVSGVGKSTIIKELRKKGFAAIDIDSVPGLCHWQHKLTSKEGVYKYGIGRDWLEAHNYICDPSKLKKLIDKQKSVKGAVVVAGLASNQDDYLDLFDRIFLLHCDKKLFLHRLSTRKGNEFARDKSGQEHVLSWYKKFESDMRKRGVISINTKNPINVVVGKITNKIRSK